MSKKKINFSDMTGDELKNILDILNKLREDISTGRLRSLPINNNYGILGKLNLEIKVYNNNNYEQENNAE